MFVPLTHDGVKGFVFKFVCPGYSKSFLHESLLLLKNATVNRNLGFDDVCVQKQVSVAYNNDPSYFFEVSNITGELVKYPVKPWVRYVPIVHEWEVQEAFLVSNNIKPKWINANFTWGTLNHTTGQWSGAVGLIQKDEADYALFEFSCTHPRSKVAECSPGILYSPLHWLTRYPRELSPTWNLLGLFNKEYIHKSQPDLNYLKNKTQFHDSEQLTRSLHCLFFQYL